MSRAEDHARFWALCAEEALDETFRALDAAICEEPVDVERVKDAMAAAEQAHLAVTDARRRLHDLYEERFQWQARYCGDGATS